MEEVTTEVRNQFYRRAWIQTIVPTALSSESKCWVVFLDEVGLGKQISAQLKGATHKVVEVKPGKKFARLGRYEYAIRPNVRSDYDALIGDLQRRGNPPENIVHLWSVLPETPERTTGEILDAGFYSLHHLAQAVAEKQLSGVDISLISNQLHSVSGEKTIFPARATAHGAAKIISREFPGITCRSIDCDPAGQGMSYVAVQIIAELCAPSDDRVIAYRGNRRWIEGFEALEIPERTEPGKCPKQNGVYVFSGAFGEFELAIVEWLLSEFQARIALVGCRCELPAGQWDAIRSNETLPDFVRSSIEKLLPSQAQEGRILAVDAELTRPDDAKRGMQLVLEQFGPIAGLIHTTDDINEELRTISSPEKGEASLARGIKKAQVVAEISRELKTDFCLFSSLRDSQLASGNAIHQVAVSEFFSSLSSMHAVNSIVSLTWEAPGPNGSARTTAVKDMDRVGKTEELVRFLKSNPTPGLSVFHGELPRGGDTQRKAKNRSNRESDIQAALTKWWQELLEFEPINLDDDFFDVGGHSLTAAQLIARINKTYDLEMGLSIMFEARTIRQLSETIITTTNANQKEPRPWSPVVPIQPKGKQLPLYVISGVGGNVIKFHSLAFYLGEEQPVFGLLPRGLDGREPFISRVEDLATYYVEAIRSVQPTGPYRLAGYSFGGIVAFEAARQIVEGGESVDLLVLFDTLEWNYGMKVLNSLPVRERFEIYREHADAILSTEDRLSNFRRLLAEKIARIGYHLLGILGRPIPQKLATIEEVSTFAAANYKPRLYQGKIVLFRSTKRGANEGDDEYLGWGELATGGVEVNQVPSTHFDILLEPAVKALAEQLRAYLNRSQSQKTMESELSPT
jgi:thioesterase domain-containing protein/acyl carrier protein